MLSTIFQSQIFYFVCLATILFIGDVVATKTKAWVPSVFVCAFLFLCGYWTFFPKEIVAISGIPTVVAVLCMYLIITNMGTLLSIPELIRQWKTITIALSGIAGICVLCYTVGMVFFPKNTVIVAIPPLVGGIVSALIMSGGAAEAGWPELSVFAILIYVMQGFAGYPLTAVMLKREGRRVLAKYRAGEWKVSAEEIEKQVQEEAEGANDMPHMLKFIPKNYNTEFFKFMRVALMAFLAFALSVVLKPVVNISPFVLCLVFGVIGCSAGFLERHPLQKANGFGFAIMVLMLFIFDTLKHATPDMLLGLVPPLAVMILSAVVGMFITSFVVGKILGVSTEMAYAVSLTALYGFPADYIITVEAVKALTRDPKETQVLTNHMLPSMLVGGFVSVTIVSVLLAGFMVSLITKAPGVM